MAVQIDLNADVGESFGRWQLGDDEAVLASVTSANVACGFHAGDPSTLRATCALAAAGSVRIGAQVGYRDLAGFGRRFIDIEPEALRDDVLYQLGALDAFARLAGSPTRYVKPHGALYNAVVHHRGQAEAVLDAVTEFGRSSEPVAAQGNTVESARGPLAVMGLPGSVFLDAARERGLPTIAEAFADRAYRADATLVPRTEPGAVITDPDAVRERVVRLATRGELDTAEGQTISMVADSICLHGDTPGAGVLARLVRQALEAAGVKVAAPSYASSPDR